MGLLTLGRPLTWEETKQHAEQIRQKGLQQLVDIFHREKDRSGDVLKFGDEIEYMIIKKDDDRKRIYASLRSNQILKELAVEETPEGPAHWEPEYGEYMIEGIPAEPFGSDFSELCRVEENMANRRRMVKPHLRDDEVLVTMSAFPSMFSSTKDWTWPPAEPMSPVTQSLFFSDDLVSPHPRFLTLTENIKRRRGCKPVIRVPLFMDKNTNPKIGLTLPELRIYGDDYDDYDDECDATKLLLDDHPGFIYMDATGCGTGCCCLQCTVQMDNINAARHVYDQMTVVCPVLLAMTAATPIVRGLLANTDSRWDLLSQATDDRTPEEIKNNMKRRFDTVSMYIANRDEASRFSDNNININNNNDDDDNNNSSSSSSNHGSVVRTNGQYLRFLCEAGMDQVLAKHFSHIFIRDPLIFCDDQLKSLEEATDEMLADTSEHFENIQSSVWQSMRFKPPVPHSGMGWRLEVRIMEIQMTDFENAAFVVFNVLLIQAIAHYGLDLYIPISKVDENVRRAHQIDAINTAKFYWRKGRPFPSSSSSAEPHEDQIIAEMSITEIVNGCDEFVGLVPLIRMFLDEKNKAQGKGRNPNLQIEKYLEFVSKRASGENPTPAKKVRDFVMNHPSYQHDSRITPEIAYDIITKFYLEHERNAATATATATATTNTAHASCTRESTSPELLLAV